MSPHIRSRLLKCGFTIDSKGRCTVKPMIVSTGMATLAELDETVRTIRKSCKHFVLLKYQYLPATQKTQMCGNSPHAELFDCEVGLSDHTMGVGASVAAVAHGATVIEKHFTLRRADGGVDSAFSLEPDELKILVVETERAWQSLGGVFYGPTEAEKASLQFRRSLYIAEDIKAGEELTPKNLRIVRPGKGLPPKFYDILLGRKVNQDLKKGSAMNWKMVVNLNNLYSFPKDRHYHQQLEKRYEDRCNYRSAWGLVGCLEKYYYLQQAVQCLNI